MKQLFIILGFISLTISSNAQINLEHTFNTSIGLSVNWFNTNSKGLMYYTDPDTITNQLKIYNEDYSLYKTVTLPRSIGYRIIVNLVSEQLFNTDNSIEFVCVYYKMQSNIYQSSCKIYNENANIIKDFGTYSSYVYSECINYPNRNAKLVLRQNSNSQVAEIYSLPGSMPTKTTELEVANVQSAYPNPAKTVINLSYSLDNGQTSSMRIYKTTGQLIEQKQIDSAVDKIQLNVNSYQPGIYIYEYNGVSKKFVVN